MSESNPPENGAEAAQQAAIAAGRAASHAPYGLGPGPEDCSPHSRRPWECRSCGLRIETGQLRMRRETVAEDVRAGFKSPWWTALADAEPRAGVPGEVTIYVRYTDGGDGHRVFGSRVRIPHAI